MATFGLGMIGFFRTLRERAETPEAVRLHQGAIHVGVALVVLGIISTGFIICDFGNHGAANLHLFGLTSTASVVLSTER